MDERLLAWRLFFASNASFSASGMPKSLADILELSEVGKPSDVLISWGERRAELTDLTRYSGIVVVNGQDINPGLLRRDGFPYVRRFAVLPGLHDARWLIPRESPRLSSSALKMYTPYRRHARAKHLGVRLAARAGVSGWYRDEIIIAQRELSPVERYFRDVLKDERLHLTISTGTPGPGRKPTIGILDDVGNMRAVAKVGITPLTQRLLRNEAEILRALRVTPHDLATRVPRLLANANVDDAYVAVQSTIPGRSGPRQLDERHERFLGILATGAPTPVLESSLMRRLRKRIGQTEVPEANTRAVIHRIDELLANILMPQTIVHGDFAPWNLRQNAGAIGVFDWEYATIDGVPQLDRWHHELQAGFLLRQWGNDRAIDYLRVGRFDPASPFTPKEILGLQLTYLIDVLLRRCEEGCPPDDLSKKRYIQLIEALITDER